MSFDNNHKFLLFAPFYLEPLYTRLLYIFFLSFGALSMQVASEITAVTWQQVA